MCFSCTLVFKLQGHQTEHADITCTYSNDFCTLTGLVVDPDEHLTTLTLSVFLLFFLFVFLVSQICPFAWSNVHEVNWHCSGLLQVPGTAVQRLQKNQESEQKRR